VLPFVLYSVAGSACGDLPSIPLVVSLSSEGIINIDALAKSFSGDQGSIAIVAPTGGGEARLRSEDWP
jgi:hypothetical protein